MKLSIRFVDNLNQNIICRSPLILFFEQRDHSVISFKNRKRGAIDTTKSYRQIFNSETTRSVPFISFTLSIKKKIIQCKENGGTWKGFLCNFFMQQRKVLYMSCFFIHYLVLPNFLLLCIFYRVYYIIYRNKSYIVFYFIQKY